MYQRPRIFHTFFWLLLAAVVATQSMLAQAGSTILFDPFNVEWRYLDNGSNQGTAWRARNFNDSAWATGKAKLGYGFGDETTLINSGPAGAHYITSYYRHTFDIENPAQFHDLSLTVLRDDGIVVYINGTEVFRNNMPSGAVAFNTVASSENETATSNEAYVAAGVIKNVLRTGSNTIAVEIHQSSINSPDSVFALLLGGNYTDVSEKYSRAPYVQMVTPESAIIRWGTTSKSNSVVRFGTSVNNLDKVARNRNQVNEHEVQLTGLVPDTQYYYSTGSGTKALYSGAEYFFRTQPPVGTHPPTRIWVIGDSGRGNQDQRDVYKGYQTFAGNRYTDVWLMLGDNAYGSGTYQQYQDNFFNVYPALLRQTAVWPTLGNHDGYSVNTTAQTGPYYENFNLPKAAEAGGVASGTEAYYSYNYGNIHFVVLDAFDVNRSSTGAMAQWLEADLTANTQDWIIAYWHHPPYTKGTHDSDTEIELIEMRENILPILEQHGTDLVLTGHSHNYERSKFVQGHYGNSSTYSDGLFALDAGSGNVLNGAQAYTKAHPAVAHGGTVYAVAGTSSAAQGGSMDHPVMYKSFSKLGSMVIDVDNLALSAKFIDEKGEVQDAFTVQKLIAGSDRDGDDVPDASDNCPVNTNADQSDTDDDGVGDVCDSGTDTDGDGIGDSIDPNDDGDALDDASDNCPLLANDDQYDYDGDGKGDACDPVPMPGISGGFSKDKTGYAVAFVGDVDADGYGDYAVGAPGYDVQAVPTMKKMKEAGRAEVISGKTGLPLMAVNGAGAGDAMGFAVAGNGDVDNDGFADVLVGAPKADNIAQGVVDAGSVTVLFGPDGLRQETFYGDQAKALTGFSVALGDVNHDDHADIVIGAPHADYLAPGLVDAGSVSVLSGDGYGVLNTFHGVNARAHAGASVATGDLDNDSAADIIVGAPDDNLLPGLRKIGSVTAYRTNNTVLLKKYGVHGHTYFGTAIASADVNHDGYDDVLVGASGDSSGTLRAAGSVIVFSGADGSELAKKYGVIAQAALGNSVAAGDINADGFADIIAGAPRDDAPGIQALVDAGSVSLWSGSNYTLLQTWYGSNKRDHFGTAVSAGDMGRDGRADVLIGITGADDLAPSVPVKDTGAVQIKSGSSF
ncbi:MAG TPA: metallophosphoesterase [Pseudomonadales bacterium]|nr:metallophosphoesterase [Pseudomonadales bacterium]